METYILSYSNASTMEDADAIKSIEESDGWYLNTYINFFEAKDIDDAKEKAWDLCITDDKIFTVYKHAFTEEDY